MFKTKFMPSFVVLSLLLSAVAIEAQQPSSQVFTFSGTIPGQPDGPVALRLRLYNVETEGAPLFEETQTVTVAAEKFTVRIGDATVDGIPAPVFRNNPSLWIAFALDVTPDRQIGPRTAITSSGYAHAAQSLTGPVVTSVSTLSGDVTLAGNPPITITAVDNTLTIGAPGVLTTVTHDSTLSGEGTQTVPLGVSVPLTLSGDLGTTITALSSGGVGVRGFSTNSIGVKGDSTTSVGVSGTTSASGVGNDLAGVQGLSSGIEGKGVVGTAFGGPNSIGVKGQNSGGSGGGFGVFGSTTGTSEVAGVKGVSFGDGGRGVVGEANVGNFAAGVLGSSNSGTGVYGASNTGFGVQGVSGAGFGVLSNGRLGVVVLGTGGTTALCRNNSTFAIATCPSSLRYKTDVRPFLGGLDIVNRLRPIAFTWKQGGMRGIGLAAEEVEKVEPLLTFRNDKGEIEGVKYNELSAVFVNAFAEQQQQIKQQQEQIANLQQQNAEMREKVAALEKLIERSR